MGKYYSGTQDGRDGFIWSVSFIWFVSFNQTNQIDWINKKNHPALARHAPRSGALADCFSIRSQLKERMMGARCQRSHTRHSARIPEKAPGSVLMDQIVDLAEPAIQRDMRAALGFRTVQPAGAGDFRM